jgi:pilus assembly protein CpaE
VLAAQASGELREQISSILGTDPGIVLVGSVDDAADLLRLARQTSPDVVLLDVAFAGAADGFPIVEQIHAEAPNSSVIVTSPQGAPEAMRLAMVAGARDFLTLPFQATDLIGSIRTVHGHELQRRRRTAQATSDASAEPRITPGKVICMFSPKGGVGRTTMAVNLAIALKSLSQKRVALVDCNLPFGDVSIMMNLHSSKTIADLISSVGDLSAEVLDSVMLPHESGVRVLAAPTRPEFAELFNPDHIKQIVEAVRRENDYVVVDTWTSFHEIILGLFDISSVIVLLTTLDMPAVKNIRLFLDVANALQYPQDRIMLVLNRADSTGGLRVEDIEESIQHAVGANLVSAGELVTSSINRGIPFLLSDPQATISRNVLQLARQLLTPEDLEAQDPRAAQNAENAKRKAVHSKIPMSWGTKR